MICLKHVIVHETLNDVNRTGGMQFSKSMMALPHNSSKYFVRDFFFSGGGGVDRTIKI